MEDAELLSRYAESHSEEAMREFVQRYINLVYSAALRQIGDPHLAQDVAQTVFVALASKASAIARHPVPAAWLYTSTHFAAAKMIRSEKRRKAREQTSQTMDTQSDSSTSEMPWENLRLVLDEVMHDLSELDRQAVLLRFFESHSLAVIGSRLGLSEDAAQKRVERALAKLRTLLARRGATSTSAAVATALSANAITTAPSGLATAVASAASAEAAAIASSTATAALMNMTTLQKTITAAVLIGLCVGVYEVADSNYQQSGITARRNRAVSSSRQIPQVREESVTITIPKPSPVRTQAMKPSAVAAESRKQFLEQAALAASLQIVDGLYKTMIDQMRLTDDEARKFELLVSTEHRSVIDAIRLGQAQGLTETPGFRDLILGAATSADAELESTLGPDRFAEFQEYRQTLRLRTALGLLRETLDSSATPLTDAQVGQLLHLYSGMQTDEDRKFAPTMSLVEITWAHIKDPMIEASSSILSDLQMAALREMQQQRVPKKEVISGIPPTRLFQVGANQH